MSRADPSDRFQSTFSALPLLFVVLWSTGFIGMKWAIDPTAPMTLQPMMFLAVRFAIAFCLLALFALLVRARWPRGIEVLHLSVSGILLHACALGLVYLALVRGVEAGTSALISALQPITILTFAVLLLGERVQRAQLVGIALALLGVAVVASSKWTGGVGSGWGFFFASIQPLFAGAAIAYQRHFLPKFDLRTGTAVQFAAATLFLIPLVLLFEDIGLPSDPRYWQGMAWLVIVLSLGAIALLHQIIRAGSATTVANLFFLVPVSAAIIAFLLFGETLSPLEIVGFALTVAGVAWVSRLESKKTK